MGEEGNLVGAKSETVEKCKRLKREGGVSRQRKRNLGLIGKIPGEGGKAVGLQKRNHPRKLGKGKDVCKTMGKTRRGTAVGERT